MSDSDEIDPFVVYRIAGQQLECALWTLADGARALALFLTPEAASGYLATAQLAEQWKVFRPSKHDLLQILRHCRQAGIERAVLDPGAETAQRLFDVGQILAAAEETG